MSHRNHYFEPEADDTFNQNEPSYSHYSHVDIDFAGPSNYQHGAAAGSNAGGHHHMDDGSSIGSMFSSSQRGGWDMMGHPPAPSTLYRATDQMLGPTASYDSTSAYMDGYPIPVAVSPTEMDGTLDDASLEDLEEDMAATMIESSPRKGKGKGKKARKSYDQARLGEVNLTRAIGACLVCRVSRVRCDLKVPCEKCCKDYDSNLLLHGVCLRQSLVSTRFNKTDLLRINFYEVSVTQSQAPGATPYVGISWSHCCGASEPNFDFGGYNLPYPLPPGNRCSFKERNIIPLSAGAYSTSAPALEVFMQQHPVSSHHGLTGAFSRPHHAFGTFAEKCQNKSHVAFKDDLLVQSLMLSRELDKYHKATGDTGLFSHEPHHVAALRTKLRSAETAHRLEMEILYALEKRIYKSNPLDKTNPLSTWFVFWVLILSYQEHMHFTKYFNNHDMRVATPLHELAKHMFNGLTAVYATFFKDANPLAVDWNNSQIFEELGYDPELMSSFLNIKSEIRQFYLEKDQLSPHDILFKTLVMDNESKILALQP